MREQGLVLNNLDEYNRCIVPQLEVKDRCKEAKEKKEARIKREEAKQQETERQNRDREETINKRSGDRIEVIDHETPNLERPRPNNTDRWTNKIKVTGGGRTPAQ